MLLELNMCVETVETWRVLGLFLYIIKIVVPIIIIVMGIRDVVQVTLKGDADTTRTTMKSLFRRIVAGIIVFIVPTVLLSIFRMFINMEYEKNYDFGACTSCLFSPNGTECEHHLALRELTKEYDDSDDTNFGGGNINTGDLGDVPSNGNGSGNSSGNGNGGGSGGIYGELPEITGGGAYTGKGMGGKALNIKIERNVKDPEGRCGTYSGDHCSEVATVQYPNGTVKYYMGFQNNSKLLGGSCRAHAFTAGMNATNNTKYSTLDLQNYLQSAFGNGVLKARQRFDAAINHFNVPAKAYFGETSIPESIQLAKAAVDNGQPVIIFVAHSKCPDLAGTHHALMLIGYDDNGKVIFLDSCGLYFGAKKRNFAELAACMSPDGTANSWMRMVIFSFL